MTLDPELARLEAQYPPRRSAGLNALGSLALARGQG